MKKLIFLTLLLLLLVGAAFYINTKGNYHIFPTAQLIGVTPTPTPFPTQSTQKTQVTPITIKNGKIIGNKTITIPQNTFLVLQITSDRNDTLLISGYNKSVSLLKGNEVILSFPAVTQGSFNLLLSSTNNTIGMLKVN